MGLKVSALCVSVDYGAYLARSIARWAKACEAFIVVTAPRDEETIALARSHGALVHLTDVFWARGAFFNKGAALEEARPALPPDGWHLMVDADVIPPEDWLERVEAQGPQPNTLHGARRIEEDGRPIDDRELAGFFQLWHSSDPRGKAPLAMTFRHAGNYDSLFMMRWHSTRRRILDLVLTHQGERGTNWCGVGNEAEMARIREERRRGRSWRRETVQ